jgi:hypothetical protein
MAFTRVVEHDSGWPLAEAVQAAVAVVLEAVVLAAVVAEEYTSSPRGAAVAATACSDLQQTPPASATAAAAANGPRNGQGLGEEGEEEGDRSLATVVNLIENRFRSGGCIDVPSLDDTSDDATFVSAADGLSLSIRARPSSYCSVRSARLTALKPVMRAPCLHALPCLVICVVAVPRLRSA